MKRLVVGAFILLVALPACDGDDVTDGNGPGTDPSGQTSWLDWF